MSVARQRNWGAGKFWTPAWALFLGLLPGVLGCATDAPPADGADNLSDEAAMAIVSGELKLRDGDLDGSIADFNRAISLQPRHPAAYAGRAYVLHRKGDPEGAIADFTRAVELDPQLSTAYAARAFVRMSKGDLDRAIEDFTQALALNKEDGMAYHGRGVARSHKGDLPGAVADYTEAIRIDPQALGGVEQSRRHARADRRSRRRHRGLHRGAALDDRDEAAYTNRGATYEKRGDWAQAVADYQTALEVASPTWNLRSQVQTRLAHALEEEKARSVK